MGFTWRLSTLSLLLFVVHTLRAQQVPETVVKVCDVVIAVNCQWTGSRTQVVVTRIAPGSEKRINALKGSIDTLGLDTTQAHFRRIAMTNVDSASRDSLLLIHKAHLERAQLTKDSIVLHCTDTAKCKEMRLRGISVIKALLDKAIRSFEVPGRIKDHEDLFKLRLTEELTALSPTADACDTAASEIKTFVAAFYWKAIAQIEADPTPISNSMCVERTVRVRTRLSSLDVWARKKITRRPWMHDTVVLPVHPKRLFRSDPIATRWKPLWQAQRGDSSAAVIKQLTTELWNTYNKSSSRYAYTVKKMVWFDGKGDPKDTLVALVPTRKFNKLAFDSNPRHRVLARTGAQMALVGGKYQDFTVERVQFKFEDGAFRQVDVWGHLATEGTPMHFSNSGVPIPYAHDRQRSRELLDRFPLYAVIARSPKGQRHGSIDYILSLSDVFVDMPEYQLRTENIAPGDTVVSFVFPAGNDDQDATSCTQLRKEDTKRLFELRLFTDPVGLAAGKPNGLVQTEVARRVPLAAPKYYIFNLLRYAEPALRIQLHNQEERSLLLADAPTEGTRVIPAMDQLNRATWSTGARLNMLTLTIPRAQSDLEFNVLGYLFSTRVSDSLNTSTTEVGYTYQAALDSAGNAVLDSTGFERATTSRTIRDLGTANSFMYGAEFRWRMKPDGRYGFDVYTGVCSYVLLADPTLYRTDLSHAGRFPSVAFAGIDGWFRPSAENQWFFRARWTGDDKVFTNHFVQLQLGYNRSLSFKSK